MEHTQPSVQLDTSPESRAASASARTHLFNVLFIVGAIVVLFWRVFFLGNTLIDLSTLNNQLPWGYYAGDRSGYPYDRRDPTDMYVTREYFVVQSYRDGELPLWNPYTMAGHPIYADGVTRIFSPSLLFYRFLDVPLGYSVARLCELALGAIFLYAFLAGIGVRAQGALLGAILFAFSSHSMLHLVGLGWWGGLMWLPLMLLMVDRAITRASLACAALAGIILALQIYCGYMANQIYYIGAVVLYYLFFAWRRRSNTTRSVSVARPLATLVMIAVTLILGLGISAPAWVPVLEQLRYSNRLIVPTQIGYIYLPPWYLATLVFPDIFGAPYDARFLTLFQAVNVSHDHTLYMGIATLGALGFCLFWANRLRASRPVISGTSLSQAPVCEAPLSETSVSEAFPSRSIARAASGPAPDAPSFGYDRLLFFALLFGLAILIITTAPVYVHVTRFIPVLQTIRVIMRAGVLLVLSASVLAAFGCQLLLDAEPRTVLAYARLTRRVLYCLIGSAAACTIAAYAIKSAGLEAPLEGKGKIVFIKKALGLISTRFTPPGAGIIVPLLLGLIIVVLLHLTGTGRIPRRSFYAAILALLLVDLFWNSRNFEHAYDRSRVYPRTRITDLLASLPPGRVLPTPSDIELNRRTEAIAGRAKIITPPNTLLPYRLPTITGKDQIFPKWYQEFATLIEPQPNMSHVVFDRNQSPFFDLLDTRYILAHEGASPPDGMESIETAEGISVYRNPKALSRAFFAPEVRIAGNQADAIRVMREPAFDPAKVVVLEDEAEASATGAAASEVDKPANSSPSGSNATVTLVEDRRNTVRIATDSDTAGVLFLGDTYYPGWQADVDGAPARIYKADVAFRAVRVPRGPHLVTYVFAPRSFRLSLYGAAASVLGAIACLGLGRRRRNLES